MNVSGTRGAVCALDRQDPGVWGCSSWFQKKWGLQLTRVRVARPENRKAGTHSSRDVPVR